MDLMPYVDSLRRELAVAAEAGGDDARALAERLTAPLESAVRLTLLNVLSAAAAEITRDLAPGSVDLRLRGSEPDFVVTSAPAEQPFDEVVDVSNGAAPTAAPARPAALPNADEGTTSRINFRLPDHLKLRVEEAAAAEGLSVNAWLVRAVGATLAPDDRGRRTEPRTQRGGQSYTGWVR